MYDIDAVHMLLLGANESRTETKELEALRAKQEPDEPRDHFSR